MSENRDNFDNTNETLSLKWDEIDVKQLDGEIDKLVKSAELVIKQLDYVRTMGLEGTRTKYALANFSADLASGKGLRGFVTENEGTFSSDFSTLMQLPGTYANLSAEKKNWFKGAKEYYDGINNLIPAILKIYDTLGTIETNFDDTFDTIGIFYRFDDLGFNASNYKRMSDFITSVCMFINTDLITADNKASNSIKYLQEHRADPKDPKFAKGYREAREADFNKLMSGSEFLEKVDYHGDGGFRIDSEWMADSRIIDNCIKIAKIAIGDNLEGKMKSVIDECKEIKAICTANSGVPGLMELTRVLKDVLESAQEYADFVAQLAKGFKEGGSKEPYCYFDPMSGLDYCTKYELANIDKSGPKSHSFKYEDLYNKAENSLIQFYQDYMEFNGYLEV